MRPLGLSLVAAVLMVGTAEAGGATVKLLTGFERAQVQTWLPKTRGDTVPLGHAVCRPGDATEGKYALVRRLTARNVSWGGLKGETEEWLRYYHGTVFNATGHFAGRSPRPSTHWFPSDWSGHERLRIDAKSTKASIRLRVMLEDEIATPPTVRVFPLKPGAWVTLEINLAEVGKPRELQEAPDPSTPERRAPSPGTSARKVRLLNPARMANLMLIVEQADAATDLLVDNIRLVAGAEAEKPTFPIATDASPLPSVFQLPPGRPEPRDVSGIHEKTAAADRFEPILIDLSKAPKPSYHRLSELWRHGVTAIDETRIMLAPINQFTLDGGATWKPLGRLMHSVNAPGDGIAAAGPDIVAVYTARCACGNSPSCIYFRKIAFSDGWTMSQPALVDVDSRHCPEFHVEVLRLRSGRIWAAWFQDSRFRDIHLKARYSDDGGTIWRDPDSNALVYYQRPTHWKTPLPLAVTLWPEDVTKAPPVERANGRIGPVHPHTNLALVPYGDHVACVWGSGNRSVSWSAFDGTAWSKPAVVLKQFGGPTSATTVRGREVYVAFKGAVYRLAGDAWVEDPPPIKGADKLIADGDVVHCIGRTVTVDDDQQRTAIWRSLKRPGKPWTAAETLAEEQTPKGRQGAISIIAPQEAFGTVIPVAYGPHARWVKILRLPRQR